MVSEAPHLISETTPPARPCAWTSDDSLGAQERQIAAQGLNACGNSSPVTGEENPNAEFTHLVILGGMKSRHAIGAPLKGLRD